MPKYRTEWLNVEPNDKATNEWLQVHSKHTASTVQDVNRWVYAIYRYDRRPDTCRPKKGYREALGTQNNGVLQWLLEQPVRGQKNKPYQVGTMGEGSSATAVRAGGIENYLEAAGLPQCVAEEIAERVEGRVKDQKNKQGLMNKSIWRLKN